MPRHRSPTAKRPGRHNRPSYDRLYYQAYKEQIKRHRRFRYHKKGQSRGTLRTRPWTPPKSAATEKRVLEAIPPGKVTTFGFLMRKTGLSRVGLLGALLRLCARGKVKIEFLGQTYIISSVETHTYLEQNKGGG